MELRTQKIILVSVIVIVGVTFHNMAIKKHRKNVQARLACESIQRQKQNIRKLMDSEIMSEPLARVLVNADLSLSIQNLECLKKETE